MLPKRHTSIRTAEKIVRDSILLAGTFHATNDIESIFNCFEAMWRSRNVATNFIRRQNCTHRIQMFWKVLAHHADVYQLSAFFVGKGYRGSLRSPPAVVRE